MAIRAIPINVRILAATNRDLESAVQQGQFRRDLFFRLNVLTLRIPPLRERKQDIPLLAGHVLERVAAPLAFTGPSATRHSGGCWIMNGRAMCASWRTAWSGHALSARVRRCRSETCQPRCAIWQVKITQPWSRHRGHGILPLAEMEKRAITQAIEQLHGDKLEAARRLGIGKTTLYRKLKEYGAIV